MNGEPFIIAYRNPLEAWAWESGAVWWIGGVALAAWAIWACFLLTRMRRRRGRARR